MNVPLPKTTQGVYRLSVSTFYFLQGLVQGCGHSVDVTPEKTVVCKGNSCLVLEPGHISYSQAQPETDVPPIVQTIKK